MIQAPFVAARRVSRVAVNFNIFSACLLFHILDLTVFVCKHLLHLLVCQFSSTPTSVLSTLKRILASLHHASNGAQ